MKKENSLKRSFFNSPTHLCFCSICRCPVSVFIHSFQKTVSASLFSIVNLFFNWQLTQILLQQGEVKSRLSSQRFTEENKKLMTDFYVNTDVAYTMPGMHDEMTVWENGIKSKCRKYYSIMFLKEVYELFKVLLWHYCRVQ